MGLKHIVDDINTVDESIRSHYKESNGKFVLDVDGVVPREKLEEFRNNNIALTNETKAQKEKLEAFKDIDPAKYREYKTKAEAFKDDADIEKIISDRLSTARTEFDAKISELTSNLESTQQRYQNHLVGSAVQSAAIKSGVLPTAVEDVINRAKGVFEVKNDQVVMLKDGNVVYGKDGVTPMSASEWVSELYKTSPHLFSQNKGGGDKSGPGVTIPRDKMSSLDKIKNGLTK